MKTTLYVICAILLGALAISPRPEAQQVKKIDPTLPPPPKIDSMSETAMESLSVKQESFEEDTEKNLRYLNARSRELDSIIKTRHD